MADEMDRGGFGKVIGTAIAGAVAGCGLWWLERAKASGGTESSDQKKIAEYKRACDLLNLPYDGNFTREEMERRVRILMIKTHPDKERNQEHVDVLTEFAQNLNRARQLIVEVRHWGNVQESGPA
jgi:hypothetical protein